ncbi:Na(+)/citrate cotransporter-like [Dermacentor andersoni]|uniref:Na(+)/citrate cotransporter-like n=1 Tax=Dermacentor andersoni TaxID=34620 RepID=UPI002417E0E7|nr:sodium-dependent high-affinity dicarboxylate transporter 2-like isoform X2 [Dermacentor andersoni]
MVRQAWCKMPWGIIIVLGAVQVATRVVEEYDLLPQLFKLFKPTFWTARSHIEVQAILATISSMLAETTNNRTLSLLMMPIVQDIAESKNMYPMYYAIPVVVGASSNVIMPISIPMVVMHDIGRVPFVRLLVLGIVLKMVLVGMVLLTVNAVGRTLYDWGNQHVVPDA